MVIYPMGSPIRKQSPSKHIQENIITLNHPPFSKSKISSLAEPPSLLVDKLKKEIQLFFSKSETYPKSGDGFWTTWGKISHKIITIQPGKRVNSQMVCSKVLRIHWNLSLSSPGRSLHRKKIFMKRTWCEDLYPEMWLKRLSHMYLLWFSTYIHPSSWAWVAVLTLTYNNGHIFIDRILVEEGIDSTSESDVVLGCCHCVERPTKRLRPSTFLTGCDKCSQRPSSYFCWSFSFSSPSSCLWRMMKCRPGKLRVMQLIVQESSQIAKILQQQLAKISQNPNA